MEHISMEHISMDGISQEGFKSEGISPQSIYFTVQNGCPPIKGHQTRAENGFFGHIFRTVFFLQMSLR